MNQQDNAPRAPKAYFASARAYALDLAATLFLFVSVSVMAGRIWRFPFDDEIAPFPRSSRTPSVRLSPASPQPTTSIRRCPMRCLPYRFITMDGGGIGLFSAYWIFTYRLPSVRGEFTAGPIRAALTDLLGFFGGGALGIGQAWIVAPVVIVFALAAASAVDRREPAKPVHLLLLMLSGPVFMALAGFATPRSFLYLAPVVAGLMIMFCDQQLRGAHSGRLLAAVAVFLTACVSAIANINSGMHPFKRNLAIPYQAIFDFIRTNANGSFLVISTDPVEPWVLRTADDGCAGYFSRSRAASIPHAATFRFSSFPDIAINPRTRQSATNSAS
jgi:uncharacterized protein YggT (Ycf19 family)